MSLPLSLGGVFIGYFFRTYLLDRESAYILAGDETVVSKSGQSTYGLSRFFSSVSGKTLPGLAFFSLSLVSVKARRSYPLLMEQIVRGAPSPPETSEDHEETQGNMTTEVFQVSKVRHKKFPDPLNVVCLLKTHLPTQRKSHTQI